MNDFDKDSYLLGFVDGVDHAVRKAKTKSTCKWVYHVNPDMNYYLSSCTKEKCICPIWNWHAFIYCPYCGNKIEEVIK